MEKAAETQVLSPAINMDQAEVVAEEFANSYRHTSQANRESWSVGVVFSSTGPVPIYEVTVERIEKRGCLAGRQKLPMLHVQVHGDDARVLGVWER